LMQALNHLISNAAKFSPRDGLILIRVGVHQGKAIITVQDNGPGIAPSHQQDIFEKFYQIDSATNRKFEGSGLGLSISKAIVKQHAGKISVQSQEGSGATFILEFPLYRNLQQVC